MSSTTQDVILYIRNVHPTISTINLSVLLGVSRQRINQILKKNNLPTNTRTLNLCAYCSTPCRKPLKYCSSTCRSEAKRLDFTCEECGIVFQRTVTYANARAKRGYKHTWCSKHCQGKTLGRLHGWNTGSTKYNYKRVKYENI